MRLIDADDGEHSDQGDARRWLNRKVGAYDSRDHYPLRMGFGFQVERVDPNALTFGTSYQAA
jgi:hypothetical protein